MSMLSAQINELRKLADKLQEHGTFTGFGGTTNTDPLMLEAATAMRDAANSISTMHGDYERGVEQASAIYKEVIREYVAENARLRELIRDIVRATHPADRAMLIANAAEFMAEAE